MIIDDRLEFADATSVGTPNNTTVNCGDQIDLGVARDVGDGQPMWLVVTIDTTIGSGGAATVRFQLASDASASIAVDGNQTIHVTSSVYALAALVAGQKFAYPLPLEGAAYERFLGFQIVETAGQALNAGAVSAFLTCDPPATLKTYADASN